jgi:hypothetical protein
LHRSQGEHDRHKRGGTAQNPLNSLLQNQKIRLGALSSKAVSLLGKFPLAEPVRDCGRNNKKRAVRKADPRLISGGGNTTASFLVPTVTALHEQTPDANARRQA